MKDLIRNKFKHFFRVNFGHALLTVMIPLLFSTFGHAESVPPNDLSHAEIMRLGERMYREGILPSGKVMETFIRGDVAVDSSAFSCSSCHLRAGLGSFEGGVVTPPTTGNKLYKPYRRPPSFGDVADRAGRFIYAKTAVERPPYTRETLATALRFGTDPTGQVFNDVMPRYPLTDRDMSILISYLEALSSEPSPGASSKQFKFATIITDDVSQEDRQALLLPLQTFIAQKNQQMGMFNDFIKFGYSPTIDMQFAFRSATLDIWELKGPPESWPGQLAAYYNANPVFAVLGGISNSDWRPIHEFCEAQRLPCLFPITDFPVVSETDWYTYYFNKGYTQEGEAVARYLNRLETISTETPVLQIIQDSQVGKALAAGFRKVWKECEQQEVTTLTLSSQQLLDQAALDKLLTKHKPEVLILWTDAELLPNLPALVAKLPANGIVFVSSGYLGKKTATIPENVRDRVYITYPYRLTPYVGSKVGGFDAKVPILASSKDFGNRRITSRSIAMLQQTTLQGLNLIYDNLYRDHLLDIMSMQMDVTVRDYERFSFGPGQRYVSKGCYIIQLGPGLDPPLLQRSNWVMY
ncbi:MAG TPA: amino acid ABC transporter substrate-binding protein [Geobacter sp.]|nr:amino acid ABC transporter substrate-binding protein [Geobacter sp.]